ncbi:MAG: DUF3472 domain-containing protein [Actinobacteria bacterium]|uniref:Unannotated protein n=1 Tax=freshwater metagenome TaxID=449393 RepID=A0A6J7ESZ3_9ZZZZ|nr:DUF3472 domain-containing protein [Actinomycetota bacterium]
MTRATIGFILSFAAACAIALTGSATAAPSHRLVAPEARGSVLGWDYVSRIPVVPGTLVDGAPDALQDQSLNSSFVVRRTAHGRPVAGARITWRASDSSSHIALFAPTTDADGRARIWYFAGQAPVQRITATDRTTGQRITFTMRTAEHIEPTVGRYVALYFSAPASVTSSGTNQAYTVTATPQTDPTRTYYELITAWQQPDPSEVSFYGGIQNFDCSNDNDTMAPLICGKGRGSQRGHLAIFSAWNAKDAAGNILAPRVAHLPDTTFCADFTGEGNGLKCTAPLDWHAGRRIVWKVEKLPGATNPAQRVRSSVSLDDGVTYREIATFDLPVQPDFRTISPFVENWGGDEAPTCLDVALRHLTINAMSFFDGTTWSRPASASAMGGIYSDDTTACENYSITSTPDGLSIKSGGQGNWLDIRPALAQSGSDFPLRSGFADSDQVRYQWQDVGISTVR